MHRSSASHALLSVLALLAWAGCIVACRAAFSPDGKKVIFPYLTRNGNDVEFGVALHDRETGATTKIYSSGKDERIMVPLWTSDGKRIVIVSHVKAGKDRLQVLMLSPGEEAPTKTIDLPESADLVSLFNPPPLLDDRYLFLGGDAVHRLDLETADIAIRKGTKNLCLAERNGKIYYLQAKVGKVVGYEIGTVQDPRGDLTLATLCLIPKADAEEFLPFLAVSRDGGKVALVVRSRQGQTLLVISGKEAPRRIPIERPEETGLLGNLEWSPDEKVLYGASAKQVNGDSFEMGLCEIPLEGGAPRRTRLLTSGAKNKKDSDATLEFFQISLSPDGKTAAALATYLDKIDPSDRALYLIDLASPERKVTKVPVPAPGLKAKKSGDKNP